MSAGSNFALEVESIISRVRSEGELFTRLVREAYREGLSPSFLMGPHAVYVVKDSFGNETRISGRGAFAVAVSYVSETGISPSGVHYDAIAAQMRGPNGSMVPCPPVWYFTGPAGGFEVEKAPVLRTVNARRPAGVEL